MKSVVTLGRANHSLKPDRNLLNYKFEQYRYSSSLSPCVTRRPLKNCPYRVSQGSDISYQATRLSCLFNHILVSPSGEPFYLSSASEDQVSLLHAEDDTILCTFPLTETLLWNITHRWLDERTLLLLISRTLYTLSLDKDNGATIHAEHVLPHPSLLLYDFTQDREVYLVITHKEGDGFPHNIIRYSDYSVVCTIPQTGIARFVAVREGYLSIVVEGKLKSLPLPPPSEDQEKDDDPLPTQPKPYTWSQDSETIEVVLEIPRGLEKSDLLVDPTLNSLEVRTHGGQCLLDIRLFGRIEPENTTWSFAGSGKVEITMIKYQEAHNWAALEESPGFDHAGNLINSISDLSAAELQTMRDRLASLSHLTSDQLDSTSPLYTPSKDLEECDGVDGEPVLVQGYQFTPEGGDEVLTQTHLVELSPGCLLTTESDNSFTISHNVDACVYEVVVGEGGPWRHVRTCNALNTIQATKTQKKFIVSPQSGRYTAIIDISRNVYLYMSTEGGNEGNMSIVSIEGDVSEIIGVAARESSLLLLTEESFIRIEF
eukprot:sb/3463678/